MKELKTLYPYGLNDKCSNVLFSDFSNDRIVYSIFNKQNIKRGCPRKKEKCVEKKIDRTKTFID